MCCSFKVSREEECACRGRRNWCFCDFCYSALHFSLWYARKRAFKRKDDSQSKRTRILLLVENCLLRALRENFQPVFVTCIKILRTFFANTTGTYLRVLSRDVHIINTRERKASTRSNYLGSTRVSAVGGKNVGVFVTSSRACATFFAPRYSTKGIFERRTARAESGRLLVVGPPSLLRCPRLFSR